MHPTKFLGCNSWTLPFPIPAGGQGSPGLQRPRSRAGPAGQSSGLCPLDFQGTLHCWKNHTALSFPQRGEAAKALTPKARPFCHCQVGEPREWSTWFPAPCSPSYLTCGPRSSSPLTGCPSMGTQERMKWAFPAAMATPREHNWDPRPRSTTRPPTRASRVGPAPGALPVRAPPSPRAMGEPHPHARFQERLLDLFHLLPLGETRGQVNLPRWFNG